MQKKIIALAVAGLVSGAAFAQSNVTVYGQVNMAYQSISGTKMNAAGTAYSVGSATAITQKSLANMDSRLGFKGEEALGGGTKAVFVAEFGFNPDQGGTNQTSSSANGGNNGNTSGLASAARQTYVGLSSGFGTMTMGRQYTPFFETAALVDPFGAATGNVASAGRLHPITAAARADNAFKYDGAFPMGGGTLLVGAMIGMSERATNAVGTGETGKLNSFKFAYAGGPLVVGLATINLKDNAAGTAAVGTDTKATAIGGTYDLGMAKLHVINDRVKVTNSTADRKDWLFGVTVPFGAHTVKASYNKVNEGQSGVSDNDATQIGLGYDYAMSKRTKLFANYSKITNKGNAAFGILSTNSGLGSLGAAAAAERTTGIQMGIGHSF